MMKVYRNFLNRNKFLPVKKTNAGSYCSFCILFFLSFKFLFYFLNLFFYFFLFFDIKFCWYFLKYFSSIFTNFSVCALKKSLHIYHLITFKNFQTTHQFHSLHTQSVFFGTFRREARFGNILTQNILSGNFFNWPVFQNSILLITFVKTVKFLKTKFYFLDDQNIVVVWFKYHSFESKEGWFLN